MMQTATAWLEREDGTRISWAGPFAMTEARRRAYVADAREMIADLSTRRTWPVSTSMGVIRIVSLEVVEPDGRVSLAWTAPGE